MIAPPTTTSGSASSSTSSATNTNHRIPVSYLSICPRNRFLAIGTARGTLSCYSLADPKRCGDKTEFSHTFHMGYTISSFIWDDRGERLFSACSGGIVALTRIRLGVSAFFGNVSTEMLLKEETGIIQMDLVQDFLLVSSQTRVLILNLNAAAATTESQVVQIGTKLRQGNFGACFHTTPGAEIDLKVFSTRPGKRLWIADPQSGRVLSTLKFTLPKQPNGFRPPPIVERTETGESSIQEMQQTMQQQPTRTGSRPTHFYRVHVFTSDAAAVRLVIWSPATSNLYLIDPNQVQVTDWCVELGKIHDIAFDGRDKLFILHGPEHKVSVLSYFSTEEAFIDAFYHYSSQQKAEIALAYGITERMVLKSLVSQLSQDDQELRQALTDRLNAATDDSATSDLVTRETSLSVSMSTGGSKQLVNISDLEDDDPVFLPLEEQDDLATTLDEKQAQQQGDTANRSGLSTYFPLTLSSYLPALPTRQQRQRLGSGVGAIDQNQNHHQQQRFLNPSSVEILQTAMSVDNTGENMQVQVLMEAISSTIWETSSKFESNLPFHRQLNLPSPTSDTPSESSLIVKTTPAAQVDSVVSEKTVEKKYTYAEAVTSSVLPTADDTKAADEKPVLRTERKASVRIYRRSTPVAPIATISYAHVLDCDFEQKNVELDAFRFRQFDDLSSEFVAATYAAQKEPRFVDKLWPASGITRLTAYLTHLALHQENFGLLIQYLEDWLSCFNPCAMTDEEKGDTGPAAGEGWTRSSALVNGDGLPLTRNDWHLVRQLVTLYFQLKTTGKLGGGLFDECRRLPLDETAPCTVRWTVEETYRFVEKYRMYVVFDLAAECCNEIESGPALDSILDAVLANANVARRCDDIVRDIAENQIQNAMNELASPHEETCLCLILHLLDVLFKHCETQAIKLCAARFPKIQPWNVRRTLFGSTHDIMEMEEKLKRRYFKYLSLLFQQHVELAQLNLDLFEQFVRLGVHLNESDRWSRYMTSQPHLHLWDLFVRTSNAANHADAVSQLVRLSFEYQATERFTRLEYLCAHFPTHLHQFMSTCVDSASAPFDQICRYMMTSEDKIQYVLSFIGVDNVMDSLLQMDRISYDLAEKLIAVRQLEQTQVKVVCQLLELLDIHIWSNDITQPKPVCSQLETMIESMPPEQQQSQSERVEQLVKADCQGFWEDQTYHWGTKIVSDTCTQCQVLITAQQPVVLCVAGHPAHQTCMQKLNQDVCSQCLFDSFTL